MSEYKAPPKRAPDGRFVPRDGAIDLPPKQQQPRNEYGKFIKRERLQSSKPYSNAIRDLFDTPEGEKPEGWGSSLTEAQALAMVHISMARAGNVQVGMMIVDRAEGKVPQAAEDREAAVKAGEGIKILADLLGIDVRKFTDVEVIDDALQIGGPTEEVPRDGEEGGDQSGDGGGVGLGDQGEEAAEEIPQTEG